MKTGAAVIGMFVTAGLGAAVTYSFFQAREGGSPPTPRVGKAANVDTVVAAETEEDVFKVPVGDSVQKGPDDALVTIVEFSDFECPFCARVNPTLEQIEEKYGDDVRFVFKHNPLPFHRNAPLASEYALAAAEQGKFWEMHDKLFENQKALKEPQLDEYARELGLNLDKIHAYVESGKGKKVIAEDQKLARSIGASGTPSFYINGVKVAGAQPLPKFEKVIDDRMAAAKALVAKGTAKADVYAALTKDGRTSPPPPPKREEPKATRQNVELRDGTPKKGADQPLVTIVEFSDFQCPFCSRVNPTLDEVLENFGDEVQIQFRNQPLSFHKQAMPAAKAALAAHQQGKFWAMHDKLFENQKALSDDDLKRYAKEIGLNVARFEKDMNSDAIAKQIAQDQADARKWGARGTPTLFVNGVPVRGAQPYAAFEKVIKEEVARAQKLIEGGVKRSQVYGEVLKREAGKEIAGEEPSARRAPPEPTGPVEVDIGRAPTEGKKGAPIEVVVYSDFECPFCGRVNPSIEKIKEDYGDKVVVAFKHYPLPFHRNAKPAAVASLAAHRQGKFWPMHDKLFANQRALSEDDLVSYAKDLGLDVAKFEKDMKDPELMKWVESDMAEGQKIGVRGTPATFINGRMVSGAQPYDAFKKIIDDELGNS
jgi:protein-disulfide isomerase